MRENKIVVATVVSLSVLVLAGLLANNIQLRNTLAERHAEATSWQNELGQLTVASDKLAEENKRLETQLLQAKAQLQVLQQQTGQIVQVLRESVSELKNQVEASQAELDQYQSQ